MKKIIFFAAVLFLFSFGTVSAHQPNLVYLQKGDITITNPELSRAFYDELKGALKDYFINSDKDFNLYINLLVPAQENPKGRYSARVFLLNGDIQQEIAFIDGSTVEWKEYYEEFGRDYYYQGPEFEKQVLAGKYKIEVFSADNTDNKGKYVLAVGKTESFDFNSLLNIYWQLPTLKLTFFKTSVLQFFLTYFGIGLIGFIGLILIFIAFVFYLVGQIRQIIKHNQAKTMLLTSDGMVEMKDEIIRLLQKPAYDINVAFIFTASKQREEYQAFMRQDWLIMRDEMGFNLEEIDIEGKTEGQLYNELKIKDIIYVEGGNAFYLLNAMRRCNFEKVIRKLLKWGIVYIGVSAGSIVAGKTIKTAEWLGDENIAGMKNLNGLNLVPFDIFPHYDPKYDEVIKQKIKSPKKRQKKLRLVTDQQAILVQGKDSMLIGDGEQIII